MCLRHFAHMDEFLDVIEEACKEMRAVMPATPLQRNAFLSEKHNANIYLKREDLTPVRSYKIRGAYNAMRKAVRQGRKNFVCASAGNHAQGVAFAARHYGVHAVVFMPVATPHQKIHKTRVFGGDHVEVRLFGDYFDESLEAALDFAKEKGAYFLAPFDDLDVIEGQATIGKEIADVLDQVDHLVMPVGGGGLSAGLTSYFQAKKSETEFHFVEPLGASSLKASLQSGEARPLKNVDSFVDGAAVARIGKTNFEFLKSFDSSQVITVPENRLCMTMVEMLNVEGIVLEPAGALAIDALRDVKLNGENVVVIVSGGNFDFERLPDVKERAMRFEGTKKYIVLRLPQRPGALKDFLGMLGDEDDIARFEYMKKSARQFGTVLLGLETSDPDNFKRLFDRLELEGFGFTDITNNDELGAFLI